MAVAVAFGVEGYCMMSDSESAPRSTVARSYLRGDSLRPLVVRDRRQVGFGASTDIDIYFGRGVGMAWDKRDISQRVVLRAVSCKLGLGLGRSSMPELGDVLA